VPPHPFFVFVTFGSTFRAGFVLLFPSLLLLPTHPIWCTPWSVPFQVEVVFTHWFFMHYMIHDVQASLSSSPLPPSSPNILPLALVRTWLACFSSSSRISSLGKERASSRASGCHSVCCVCNDVVCYSCLAWGRASCIDLVRTHHVERIQDRLEDGHVQPGLRIAMRLTTAGRSKPSGFETGHGNYSRKNVNNWWLFDKKEHRKRVSPQTSSKTLLCAGRARPRGYERP